MTFNLIAFTFLGFAAVAAFLVFCKQRRKKTTYKVIKAKKPMSINVIGFLSLGFALIATVGTLLILISREEKKQQR